tara:strand:- start:896 stop:1192 length:297 start_codon:yes stop_codon:yes gene_type:complete
MKKSINLFLIFLFISSCAGFKLKKEGSGDEFLVEKKSPLVLPPDYGKLPKPDGQESITDEKSDNSFEKILTKDNKENPEKQIKKNNSSIEKSILEKIK